jgi:hypothetical protein
LGVFIVVGVAANQGVAACQRTCNANDCQRDYKTPFHVLLLCGFIVPPTKFVWLTAVADNFIVTELAWNGVRILPGFAGDMIGRFVGLIGNLAGVLLCVYGEI